jgi:hypothetical protein
MPYKTFFFKQIKQPPIKPINSAMESLTFFHDYISGVVYRNCYNLIFEFFLKIK